MATSGTAAFNLDLQELVEEAGERCGYEVRTGYDFATARRSLNLLLADWANRGLNMWTFEQQSFTVVAGQAVYELPADTVDLMDVMLRTGTGQSQQDLIMSRIALPQYASMPSKNTQGRPLQFFVQRLATPSMTLWPVPDGSTTYTVVYWRLRRLQDSGTGGATQDVPFRFLPALVAGLAYYLALKVPGGLDRLQVLKAQYDETLQMAMDEDRTKTSLRLVPFGGF
jgi:hypothetical protein